MTFMLKKLCIVQLLLYALIGCNNSPEETAPQISNETYLGVNAPLSQPLKFKPGFVSKESIEFGMAVHPNLEEFYFTRLNSSFQGTIYFSKMSNGTWSIPEPASFSGKYNDADPFVTSDGRYLYFSSDRPLPNGLNKNKRHIWYVTKTENGWSDPASVEFDLQSGIGESSPTLTEEGTLYFIADFSDSGVDCLFRAECVNGKFMSPQYCNIMKNGNGIVEVEPFVAPDESFVLFYSAGRADNLSPNGQVGDIYISFRNNDNSWQSPKNIGHYVNTTGEESHPTLTPDGKYLFFGRNVGRDNGFVDVFWVDAGFINSLH